MPELHWQKSTFSGGPQSDCLNVAAAPDGTIRLRESDAPGIVLIATPHELAAFLAGIKSGTPRKLRRPEEARERRAHPSTARRPGQSRTAPSGR